MDLSSRTFTVIAIKAETSRMFLGGKGLGLYLLSQRLQPGTDPLGGKNVIIFTTGVLAGTTAPCSSRFSAVTKSPLTGIITSSSCGGLFGIGLKTSGWDGLIIKGIASEPTYLVIDSGGVKFKNGLKLWGKDSFRTQDELKKEGIGTIAIGPAGENLVKFANLVSDNHFLGRGGMGAVLGAKKLKGIVAVGGEYNFIPANEKKFNKIRKKCLQYINRNAFTSQTYRKYGTSSSIMVSSNAGILPVKNFSAGKFTKAQQISGEYYRDIFNTTSDSCSHCPIQCGHRGKIGDKSRKVPEYETLALLGSNLAIADPVKIAEWNEICSLMGMDTISAGGTLAWVMEATEKKLITTDLKFGSPHGIKEALMAIAYNRNFGREMAKGSRALGEKYGGSDFAIQVKGLEVSGYDPRGCVGMGLNYAVANRGGCHLSSFLVGLEVFFKFLKPYSVRGKHILVRYFENFYSVLNSITTCQFTAYAYIREPVLTKYTPLPILRFLLHNFTRLALLCFDISLYPGLWSSITGIKLSSSQLLKAGERIHILERYLNIKEGINKKDDTLPAKMLHHPLADDPDRHLVPLEKMLKKYYRVRGYNSQGIPLKGKLKKLGLDKI